MLNLSMPSANDGKVVDNAVRTAYKTDMLAFWRQT